MRFELEKKNLKPEGNKHKNNNEQRKKSKIQKKNGNRMSKNDDI